MCAIIFQNEDVKTCNLGYKVFNILFIIANNRSGYDSTFLYQKICTQKGKSIFYPITMKNTRHVPIEISMDEDENENHFEKTINLRFIHSFNFPPFLLSTLVGNLRLKN